MGLAVFDIGGSAVKYGYWNDKELTQQGKFKTPDTFEEMKAHLKQVVTSFEGTVEGVAMSAPGAVNENKRVIEGISAVPYLHNRPIYKELEEYLLLPVTIENDANCAGIAEIELGSGRNNQHVVFVVLGTGVGGAVFINRQLYKGAHLFGGEFGLMMNRTENIFSSNGTVVKVADKYKRLTNNVVNGKDIFEKTDKNDPLAYKLLNDMYDNVANALYNIQVSLDPELVIIGGGVSARPEIANQIKSRLKWLLEEQGVSAILPEVRTCHFGNDANLIGAAMNFYNKQH
ncbi:MAG: ROK family protein [Vagococcus sp.]